jgi:hypothetical protein
MIWLWFLLGWFAVSMIVITSFAFGAQMGYRKARDEIDEHIRSRV